MRKFLCLVTCFIILLLPCLAFADSPSAIQANDITLQSVDRSLLRISANDTTGFKSVMLSLLGDYEADVTDYTYTSSNGYTSHSIEVTPDYAWLGSCAVFIIVIFCCFRLVGGILCLK